MAAAAELEPERLERVLECARGRDWRELTTEEIAAAVGLSRMTLYRRGIDKDALLAQLGRRLEVEYQDAVVPALVAGGPGAERLRMALESLCAVNERYLHMLDALGRAGEFVFHEQRPGPVLTRVTFTDALRRILDDGVFDGSLRASPAGSEELATLLFNATGWTYRHMRIGHRWDPERVRAQLVELLLAGVVA